MMNDEHGKKLSASIMKLDQVPTSIFDYCKEQQPSTPDFETESEQQNFGGATSGKRRGATGGGAVGV